MSSIIEWNIRGLQANREELSMLLSDFDPTLVCLQETYHRSDKPANFSNYSFCCRTAEEVNGILHGGVGILVKNGIPHKLCQLNTNLQTTALLITCHKTITVCSIYLPPSLKLNSSDLYDLITQLPPPVLLLGDYNAHSSLWGCPKTDIRGKHLLHKHNLCLLNDGSSTYMHAATASVSAIDLCICSPNIFLDVQWKVHEDLCGSDHHPITIFYDLVNTSYATPSWKLCKENWDHFAECASKHLGIDNSDTSVEDFSKKLVDIATYTIPRSKLSV